MCGKIKVNEYDLEFVGMFVGMFDGLNLRDGVSDWLMHAHGNATFIRKVNFLSVG